MLYCYLLFQLDLFLDHDDPESLEPLELMNLRHVREVSVFHVCVCERERERGEGGERERP